MNILFYSFWVTLSMMVQAVIFAPAYAVSKRRMGKAQNLVPMHHTDNLWKNATTELTVVVPFYNTGATLATTLKDIVNELTTAQIPFEILAVSDGSTDGSEKYTYNIHPNIRTITYTNNKGKAAALRTGFLQAQGRYIAMVDSDGDIHPRHIVNYYLTALTENADVVYADKTLPESESGATAARKTISKGFSTLVKAMFRMPVNDTQTGCKVFTRETIQTVTPTLQENQFAFDVEFFVANQNLQPDAKLVKQPVTLEIREAGSTVKASSILRTFLDTLTIYGRKTFTSTYAKTVQPVTTLPTFTPAVPYNVTVKTAEPVAA